jgi:hypothetical protein
VLFYWFEAGDPIVKNRIESVCQSHLDANGEFQWPADATQRNQLASRFLGASIVSGMDNWSERAIAKLESESVSIEQKQNLKRLIFETVQGVVFSILVKLDQFPYGNLDLLLSDVETEQRLASIVDGDIFDLHDRLGAWLAEFSEYPKEFGV